MTTPSQPTMADFETALVEAVKSLAVDSGIVTSVSPAAGNTLQDASKRWAAGIHTNRLVRIIKGVGAGQQAQIQVNTLNLLMIRGTWASDIGIGSEYVILNADFMQMMRDVFGGGANISATNPLPVSLAVGGALHIDPFTDNTGLNILPANVRTSAADAFRLCKVHCHFAAPTSNPIAIALDAAAGVVYDTILRTIPMGANQDITALFDDSHKFETGDIITVAWTNDIGAVAWAVELGWED